MIAVTGITGHSGRYFLEELISQGCKHPIRCLVRSSSNTTALDHSGLEVEKIVGSIEDKDILHTLFRGVDCVVHITNIRYSPLVLQTAIEENVRRVILVHTTGIYSRYKSASEGYKRIEAEIQELLHSSDSNIDVTILRPTMIFGDLQDHNISKFIRMAAKLPIIPEINHGHCKIRPVNARDLGKAYYQVLNTSNLPELAYDVTGECSVSMHDMFVMIGSYLGKKIRFLSVPMAIGVFGAKVVKAVSLGRVDLVEQVLRMGEDRDYLHEEATRDFNYQPEPFSTGLKREVEQYLEKI